MIVSYPSWRRPDAYPMPKAVLDSAHGKQLSDVLADWRSWQQSAGLSERTINERASVVRTLLAFTDSTPADLTGRDIMKFLSRPGINNTSKATYHSSIRAFCAYLVRTGQRIDDPTVDSPKPKRRKSVPRPIEPHQLEATLNAINSRRAHKRKTRMQVLLAAYAGLRVHEIAKIRGEDVDRSAGLLYVTGKGLKSAALPLHKTILEAAEDFPEKGYWFPSYSVKDEPICPHAVSKNLTWAMAAAGVKATPHQIRHLFGTALVRNGVDLRTVQELLRHENLATTAIYTQVSDESRRRAIAGL